MLGQGPTQPTQSWRRCRSHCCWRSCCCCCSLSFSLFIHKSQARSMNPQHVRCTVVGPCGIHTRYGKRNTQHDRTTTAKAAQTHSHTHSHTETKVLLLPGHTLGCGLDSVQRVFCTALRAVDSDVEQTLTALQLRPRTLRMQQQQQQRQPAGKLLRRRRRRHGKISLLIFCNCHSDVARQASSSVCE